MKLITANKFVAILAARYGVSFAGGDLETAYKDVRALVEIEYSPRIHAMRTASKRMNRDGDYIRPGANWQIGATDEERCADRIAAKRAASAARDIESAAARMDEYDGWTRYKHLLAILTGRYDGRSSYASDPEYGRFIRIAYAIRRRVARAEWATAVAACQAEAARKAAYEESIATALPPSTWGRTLNDEERQRRWFALPLRERHGELRSAIFKKRLELWLETIKGVRKTGE